MDDLISRKAAIDEIGEMPKGNSEFDLGCRWQWKWDTAILQKLPSVKELPSAQKEIIRCKDCKHWREGTAYLCCDKLYGMGVRKAYDYMTDADDYCSMAERRTDGSD